jgi:hypothetical protein
MADDRPSLGEVLHRARQAGGEQRPRPWPPEDWADRDERLRALDEAMAAAVEAVVRERIATDLHRLATGGRDGVPGVERDAKRDAYLAAEHVARFGLAQERSDEEEARNG